MKKSISRSGCEIFQCTLTSKWYSLDAKPETIDDRDPVSKLDVTMLSKQILAPFLNITDLRNSKRIDFVGGIRGLDELKKRVDSGEMKVAFALYAVTMDQLMEIADTGNIMPPKTTWFEPKLRSGLVLHQTLRLLLAVDCCKFEDIFRFCNLPDRI